jgi:ribonuclease T2
MVSTFAASGLAQDRAGDFDFYVLALSWSPSYCLNAERPDPEQCDLRPTGFVVHGLWPQYEAGYPEYCATTQPRRVQRSTLAQIADVMPSDGLAQYQWEKHGTCSGLRQENYFALLVDAAARIVIPPDLRAPGETKNTTPTELEEAFAAVNPGLQPRGMAVSCGRAGTIEMRICLTRDLRFRRCAEVDEDACRRPTIVLPSAK